MSAKTIRVEVTAEDIAKGNPHDPECCPIARALTRTLGTKHSLLLGERHGRTVGVGRIDAIGAHFRLSRAVGEWVVRFDNGLPVDPFAFRVVR